MPPHIRRGVVTELSLAGGEVIERKTAGEHLQLLRVAVRAASVRAPYWHHGVHHQSVPSPRTVRLPLGLLFTNLNLLIGEM